MANKSLHKIILYFIAFVWFINGLYCKVLNGVPRHQLIVERILGNPNAGVLTILIGLSEIGMALWIISQIKSRLNAIVQIIIIAVMNALEFYLAPDLLLWGKLNAVFAILFIMLIFYNEFMLNKKISQKT